MKPRILYPLLLLTLLARFAYRGTLYLTFFTDDFFYYLLVARNLVLHHVSSFNLIQATNGYHPLWLLTITALYAIFRERPAFFVALMMLIWLLILGTCRTLRRVPAADAPGASGPLLLFTLTFAAVVSRTGMEVSLALFLLAQFYQRVARLPLENQTNRQAMLTGLLASAAILSRLDTALILAVYALFTARRSWARIPAFLLGLTPVALYAATNELWFGTLLPISGLAKNLKQTHLPSASTVVALLHPDLIHLLFAWPALLMLAAFAWQTHLRGRSRVELCVFLHPLLFYATLSFTSDWPLWTWYLYPLVPVGAILGPALVTRVRQVSRPAPGARSALDRWLTPAVYTLAIIVILSFARLNPAEVLIYEHALALRDFARTHPGRYAMGDAAGTPAYLMDQPVLQLEGLMADKPFLDRIRRSQPLAEALAGLQADFYVTNSPHPAGPCTDVREPSQAGPQSPAMQGRFCTAPLLHLAAPAGELLVFAAR